MVVLKAMEWNAGKGDNDSLVTRDASFSARLSGEECKQASIILET
jgi:hypothetical protein